MGCTQSNVKENRNKRYEKSWRISQYMNIAPNYFKAKAKFRLKDMNHTDSVKESPAILIQSRYHPLYLQC